MRRLSSDRPERHAQDNGHARPEAQPNEQTKAVLTQPTLGYPKLLRPLNPPLLMAR